MEAGRSHYNADQRSLNFLATTSMCSIDIHDMEPMLRRAAQIASARIALISQLDNELTCMQITIEMDLFYHARLSIMTNYVMNSFFTFKIELIFRLSIDIICLLRRFLKENLI